MLVTGTAAINIDASARLGDALLPFGIIVIGLSLILLMIVFRSIAVPLKATLGYLLSVGAALGAVVAVFQLGWLDALVPGLSEGPIVSFLPIFVMGVLFGLAMDYEMFLVSAMREDFVHSGEPHEAVTRGFQASARVVTAAALIMVSVFVAFIPSGTATIQQIAFGLAIGVFVDAFLVRMTLVPAVMVMLGRHAWWLPTALERALPVVDVEGAALQRKIDFDRWETSNGETTLLARDLVLVEGTTPVDLVALPGRVNRMAVPDELDDRELGLVLAGRRRAFSGELVVGGHLVPEQREAVNREATTSTWPRARCQLANRSRNRCASGRTSRASRDASAGRSTARATSLIEDLTANVPVGPDDAGRGSSRPSRMPRWGSRAASP